MGDNHSSRDSWSASGRSSGEGGDRLWEDRIGSEGESDNDELDFYTILNVSRDATEAEIRSSYHSLSRSLHPDKQRPELRDRATVRFNQIRVAYETLINPHKRVIYDRLGVDGLRQKQLEVGVKALSPEEFKVWLQDQIKRQNEAEIMSMVNSRGELVMSVDMSGLRFQEAREVRDKDGKPSYELRALPVGRVTRYFARHSFIVPLHSLGRLLITPLPSFKELIGKQQAPEVKVREPLNTPSLTFTSTVGGIPFQAKSALAQRSGVIIASPVLSVGVVHIFPQVDPTASTSISTCVPGLEVEINASLYPNRTFTSSLSRSFGPSRLVCKTTYNTSPITRPPVIETTYARRVAQRGSVFMTFNSGATHWPSAVSQLLGGPGLASYFTVGYASMPLIPLDSDGSFEKALKGVSKSKGTESFTVSGSAGLALGGAQLGFQYGRTWFIGSPIGGERVPLLAGDTPRMSENSGIRISFEGSLGLLGLLSWEVKAARKIFHHTSVGFGLGVGGVTAANGVVFKVHWSRLGQKISVPLIVAPIPELASILYGTVVPVVSYALFETFYLRPRQSRRRRKQIDSYKKNLRFKTEKRRARALEAIEIMRNAAERKQAAQRAAGGLVILSAGFGVRGKEGEWTDVTIALAMLVIKDQIVLPKKIRKAHILGFYDPAPGEDKQLWIHYQFRNEPHETVVGEYDGCTIPSRQHLIE